MTTFPILSKKEDKKKQQQNKSKNRDVNNTITTTGAESNKVERVVNNVFFSLGVC